MIVILSTHPIQYQVPLWQELAREGTSFEVWYMTRHGTIASNDPEFGRTFAWDLNTLEGYPSQFLRVAEGARPGSFAKCRIAEDLVDLLRERKARALWIQGWQVAGYWQAAFAARGAKCELWLRAESNDLRPPSRWKRTIKRVILRQLFGRVDRFLCIGSANRRFYQTYGIPTERLYETPYAVDNMRFAKQADAIRDQRREIRSKWDIGEEAFCVLFCGKFIPKKRPMDLVRAAERLSEERDLPKIHLLFVGSGELGEVLRAACNVVFDAEGSNPGIRDQKSAFPTASFAGFLNQTEISRSYVAADVLVLPSDSGETWGLIVNEALASGTPCVVSSACGCAEDLVEPIAKEYVYSVGDIEALSSALISVYRNPPAKGAIQRVLDKHSLNCTVETIRSLAEAIQT